MFVISKKSYTFAHPKIQWDKKIKHYIIVNTTSYKTISANKQTVTKDWILVDAKDVVLGRLSSQVASILRGKNKPYYTPHVDCGDNVVIINADKIKLTGNKWNAKQYVHHTGYPGGQKAKLASDVMKSHPTMMVEKAIKGMLPKNRLGRQIYGNLYVFSGEEHDKQAQKPKAIKL